MLTNSLIVIKWYYSKEDVFTSYGLRPSSFLYCFCYFFVYIPVHVSNSMQETKKKRKKIPLTRGEVEIRQRMTVEELAQAMGKDIGESLPWETATSLIALPPVGKAKMSSVALGSGCRSIPWEGKSYPSQRKCWETQCRLKRKEAGSSKYQGRHLNVKKPGLSALSSRKASDSCAGCSLWLWFPGANLFQKENIVPWFVRAGPPCELRTLG